MLRLVKLPVVFILFLCASIAFAQSTVGELLDTDAKRLSPEEFQQEVVQRVIAGPSATGGTLEVIYSGNGVVQGTGIVPGYNPTLSMVREVQIFGQWTIGENGRVCTSMRIAAQGGGSTGGMYLPPRCQFWFKLGDKYFLSDSDSDRSARVLSRTLKQ